MHSNEIITCLVNLHMGPPISPSCCAGVDNPDYQHYPSETQQRTWLREYLAAYHSIPPDAVSDSDVCSIYAEVNKFALVCMPLLPPSSQDIVSLSLTHSLSHSLILSVNK